MTKIHPSAVIDANAELGDDVTIGPNCVIAGGASIGSGTVLDAGVVIEKNVKIGNCCTIGPFARFHGYGRAPRRRLFRLCQWIVAG